MLWYFSGGHITSIPYGYSPMYLGEKRYPCVLWYFHSTYLTTVSYSQTSKMFQDICRATAHPQKQLHFSSK